MLHGNKTHCDNCGNPFRKKNYPVQVSYRRLFRTVTKLLYYCPHCETRRARRQSALADKKKQGTGCSVTPGCIVVCVIIAAAGSYFGDSSKSTAPNGQANKSHVKTRAPPSNSQDKEWSKRGFGLGGLSGLKDQGKNKTATDGEKIEAKPDDEDPPIVCSHSPEEIQNTLYQEVEKQYIKFVARMNIRGVGAKYIQSGTKKHTKIAWGKLKKALIDKCIICSPKARDELSKKNLLTSP